jgi:isochorismate synthase EntC
MTTTTARTMSMTAVRSQEELRDALGGEPKRSTINAIRDRLEEVDRQWLAATPGCSS